MEDRVERRETVGTSLSRPFSNSGPVSVDAKVSLLSDSDTPLLREGDESSLALDRASSAIVADGDPDPV